MQMKRIPTPAHLPAVKAEIYPNFGETEYQRVMERREQVLKIIDEDVQTYFDMYSDPERFPDFVSLTGDYYIGREIYWKYCSLSGREHYQFLFIINCLNHKPPNDGNNFLGVALMFTWYPEIGDFSYLGDIEAVYDTTDLTPIINPWDM